MRFVMIHFCSNAYLCKRKNYTYLLLPFTLLILFHVCVVKTVYGILLQTFSKAADTEQVTRNSSSCQELQLIHSENELVQAERVGYRHLCESHIN